ncbi:MAG: ABC transporter permease, partial [Pikeienuella sp.]
MSERPIPFRGGGFAPSPRRFVGLGVFIVLIGLAEWGARTGWISPLTLPRPSDVLAT